MPKTQFLCSVFVDSCKKSVYFIWVLLYSSFLNVFLLFLLYACLSTYVIFFPFFVSFSVYVVFSPFFCFLLNVCLLILD